MSIADQLTLAGSLSTMPRASVPLGAGAAVTIPVYEQLNLKRKVADTIDLTVDAPVPIPFTGGVVNAHVVYLRAVGGKVIARVTSADGATQSVPVDPMLTVITSSTPITAIDLTRMAGVDTSVNYFLGEQSP